MTRYKERLMRRAGSEGEQSQLQCSLGYQPRKGKAARRERDCVVDCENFEACEEQRKKALWLTDPERKGKK